MLACAVVAACGGGNQDKLGAEVAALRTELAAVRRQAQHAEDYIAISNLQRAYGFYTDKALWDQVADLFSGDATLEIAGRGVFVGSQRIRQYYHALPPLTEGTLFLHLQMQPVITIAPDGLTARGRWREMAQIGQVGKRSEVGEGIYENAYVKQDGIWKISSLHYYTNYIVDTKDGWLKAGQRLLGPLENLPPDRPPSTQYQTYPGVFIPPFHYRNPVSGRE